MCNHHSIFCVVFTNLRLKCCEVVLNDKQKEILFYEHFGFVYIFQQGIDEFK